MKRFGLAPDEYYHICNRGVNKQTIFHDKGDFYRFLFLILYFQSQTNFSKVGRAVQEFVQHPMLDIVDEVIEKRTVELVAFCIMPNHFHLILKEVDDHGVSLYMQRILNAYGKYYNTKYKKSGHVFQGPYRLVHIESDVQMLHLSAYIHRNPRELVRWRNNFSEYEWSSYQDFIGVSRWGGLLLSDSILGEFKKKYDYKNFVNNSPTKMLKEELDYLSGW